MQIFLTLFKIIGIANLILFSQLGCVRIPNATAGEIGCKPDDITIGETRFWTLTDYWEATCDGKHYECSGSGNVFVGYQAKCKESTSAKKNP